jgi:hypothetical protein
VISFLGQTNFAKAPPIKVTLRFQPLGFDECFYSVSYEALVDVHRHLESYRDVADNARNLEKLRFAVLQDGLID